MAERANYSAFLHELCDILGVPRPDAATGSGGAYRLERRVTHHEADSSTSTRRIDLYKRDCFVLEAKQGASPHRKASPFQPNTETQHRANVRNTPQWARYMQQAKGQAEGYARDLPPDEGWPPFLIVCDVGFCFDLYADFSGSGKHYAQFPDRERFRIYLPDLQRDDVRAQLRAVWMAPRTLDPALKRAEVTRDIAALLAKLAAALEGTAARPRHAPAHVATFLMRSIFCMFAQSVGLLPAGSFTRLLERCQTNLPGFVPLVASLWQSMNFGGFCLPLETPVSRFDGGLFRAGPHGPAEPLPIDGAELDLLLLAARKDWAEVEPAIFGTLLENALDTKERGRLGAQFTPRAFVERLVLPTVMEPLRRDWDGVRSAAEQAMQAGDARKAAALVRAFHGQLCAVRVLDPACGTGNFLYVTLELMKRLEGEVLDALEGLAPNEAGRLDLAGVTVDPHQFLGLDVNPRAVPVAELVLWIGYLQWHFRTNGHTPLAEPILRDFRTIQEADALLSHARAEPDRDAAGRPVDSKPAAWPDADFIVGNPPFLAAQHMREKLGDGYAEALWAAYPKVPRACDLAMFFWWRAAQLVAANKVRRFGLITSNSIRQAFCRRVLASAMEGPTPLHLALAIPDHPWAQGQGAAAVRVAMTVAERGPGAGKLLTIMRNGGAGAAMELAIQEGSINPDLTVGTSPASAQVLRANEQVCSRGMSLHGAGFLVSPAAAKALGLGRLPGLDAHIRPYLNGKDLTGRSRGMLAIDLDGLCQDDARQRYPAVFQHLLLHVKPERDQNNEAYRRDNWWLFGRNNLVLRTALHGLPRYIATSFAAKHRTFVFQPAGVLPDNMLVCIASADAWHLGVLSSRFHAAWSLAVGGTLEDRPLYNKTTCFDAFPFPPATPAQANEIAVLADELDALRKSRLAAHPNLTLTILYNVLSAIRSGKPLCKADQDVLAAGQVGVLRHLHDRLDAAVAAAYGWPTDLPAAGVIERMVALNQARAAEEMSGQVRWLRPAFQAPAEAWRQSAQAALEVGPGVKLPDWPKHAPAQFVALRAALARNGLAGPAELARQFCGVRPAKLAGMLETLTALGQARQAGTGRYVA